MTRNQDPFQEDNPQEPLRYVALVYMHWYLLQHLKYLLTQHSVPQTDIPRFL